MKYLGLLLFLSFNLNLVCSQNFEGSITYNIKYELDSEALSNFNIPSETSEKFYKPEKYNKTVNYIFKDSLYRRNGFKKENKNVIYNELNHTLYEFFDYRGEKERVRLIDTKIKYGTTETLSGNRISPKIVEVNLVKNINGIECKLIEVDFGEFGKEQYWYNANYLKVDPMSYTSHNYEYLNEILAISESFPIQMKKLTDNFCSITLTLSESNIYEVDKNQFKIPELSELSKFEREFLAGLKGINYMDVK